jgi:hypothetical protein
MVYVCFIPEDDEDRSKHVGGMTNCAYKYRIIHISAFVGSAVCTVHQSTYIINAKIS